MRCSWLLHIAPLVRISTQYYSSSYWFEYIISILNSTLIK